MTTACHDLSDQFGAPLHQLSRRTEFYGEMKRLDDFGFILPKPGLPKGLYTLVDRVGHEEEAPLESRTRFDLHDYVVLRQEGRRYLDLYEATTP